MNSTLEAMVSELKFELKRENDYQLVKKKLKEIHIV